MTKTSKQLPRRTEVVEKELQELVESHLDEVEPNLSLVGSYVPVGRGVIDSFCVDPGGAPVIIEYKTTEGADEEPLIQALSYAAWVDQNPDAIARFIRQQRPDLLKEDTPEASRIVLIAPSFTERTKLAATMVEPDIALKRYLCFEHEDLGKWVHLETVFASSEAPRPGQPPKTYSVDYHFEGSYAGMRPLFDQLQKRIEGLGDVKTYVRKYYIAFRRRRVFGVAHVYTNKIELGLHLGSASSSPRLSPADDWGWTWLTHHLTFTKEADIDDEAMRFVRESYEWAAQP